MPTARRRQPGKGLSSETTALSDLLNALSREFVVAAVNHHATLAYWSQVYADNAALSDYKPAGMKIVSAKVSLPIAISEIKRRPPKIAHPTKAQIANALPDDISKAQRLEIANSIRSDLLKRKKLSFANTRLARDIERSARRHAAFAGKSLKTEYLSELQKSYRAQGDQEVEPVVLYRATDLKRLDPEVVLRLDFELKLE
jgi:hypothetical protein